MAEEQRRQKRGIIAGGVIGLVMGLIILGLAAAAYNDMATLRQLERMAICNAKESRLACPTSNGCQVGVLRQMCQTDDPCEQYECVIENLADGSCCDRNDFCNYEDPTKTCVMVWLVQHQYRLSSKQQPLLIASIMLVLPL